MTASTELAPEPSVSAGSAYPYPIQSLLPEIRQWTTEHGRLPSRNEIMRLWKVGAPKARDLLAAITETGPAAVGRVGPVDHTDTKPVMPSLTASKLASSAANPDTNDPISPALSVVRSWPLLVLAVPAFVAIWSGWVGLGQLAGFGQVQLLPGIWNDLQVNTAVTLPIGVETYAAYALKAWLSGHVPVRAQRFARYSTLAALGLGMAGQIAYHLMTAAGITQAPWPITTLVACLPVAVLGAAAGLAHLLRAAHLSTPIDSDLLNEVPNEVTL